MANGKQVLVAVVLALAAGGIAAKHFYIDNPPGRVAKAYAETFPVHTADSAASDVAIYSDPKNPEKSLILATDREKGVAIYDLAGSEIDFEAIGKVTDVDLRQNVKFGDGEITLVAVAAGDKREVRLFELAGEKPYLRALDNGEFQDATVQADDVCLHRDPETGEASLYVIGRERDLVAEAKANLAQIKKLASPSKSSNEADKKKAEKKEKKEKKDEKPTATVADSPPASDAQKAAGDNPAPVASHGPTTPSTSDATPDAPEKHEKKAKKDKKDKKEPAAVKPTKEQQSLTKVAAGKEKKARGFYAVQLKIGAGADHAVEITECRRIKLDGKCEGSVVDDENGALFISEAKQGIWKFTADGAKDTVDVGKLICKIGFPNPLRPDVEGIALYRGKDGKGYLIAASEGSKDFVVLEREAPYDYVGRFKIEGSGSVDQVDDSGGLAVASGNLGGAFSDGVLVFQDEKNENTAGTLENQNFKIVPWSEVARSLDL